MSESTKEIKNYRGLKCLNCNHPLDISDKYCPNCSQKNSTKRLSLKDFVDEFLANFYAYDSKVKNTIIRLFTKPGKTAKEFIDGKRLTYANPFRFYLSVSLIYFIISGLISKYNVETIEDLDQSKLTKKEETQKKPKEETQKKPKDSLKNNVVFSKEFEKISTQIDSVEKEEKKKKPKKVILYSEKQLENYGFFKRTKLKLETYENFLDSSKTTYPPKIFDTLKHENTAWNRYLLKKTYQLQKIGEEENESGQSKFLQYMEEKYPFILFVSLPFMTIVFALLYFRKKLTYAEHMVFVFNFMSFIFLSLILEQIIFLFTDFELAWILIFVFPFYFYKGLRNFYQQSRWKTILKFVILSFLLPTTASFVALFVLFIGFLLY
ncbi:DUF3667 domain-containing protein [Flavobacterium filum]|uniref:DUF3667 domain-containing protein n=1 Tax=Flavobacterium TaxID=237 RepID=UPI0004174F4B|nr:DUF3667 domain-containing protein [Flavobacterium filum]